jgi:hypothetical protein
MAVTPPVATAPAPLCPLCLRDGIRNLLQPIGAKFLIHAEDGRRSRHCHVTSWTADAVALVAPAPSA